MRKMNFSLVALTTIGFGLIGCSGGGSSSQASVASVSSGDTSTEVTVERGAVYDANVTDANGNRAVQKALQNIYTFSTTPKYPITVTGGWIDVDSDGVKTLNDVLLSMPMYSYSNIVTPITTYIADPDSSIRESRLSELEINLEVDKDELMKLPSASSNSAILAHNAVYTQIIKNDNDISAINIDTLKSSYSDLNTIATQSSDKTSEELRILIEQKVINDLKLEDKIVTISLDDLDISASEKDTYLLNNKDFTLSNVLADFSLVVDAELSTEYSSSEIVFSGIDTPLNISISNSNFVIVKNDVALDTNNTTISNGDTLKLSITTSGEFDILNDVDLIIENEFTPELSQTLNYQAAVSACSSVGLEVPSAIQLHNYHLSEKGDLSYDNYWTSDTYSLNGFGKKYNIDTKSSSSSLESSKYGVVCTKTYNPLNFSVRTKSDPNQAPIAIAGNDKKIYFTDAVNLDASLSSDDGEIVYYEWKDGVQLLSNDMNLSKSDFSVGTHDITLSVRDDEGKSSTDTITVVVYDTFTDILPIVESGSSKSVSSSSNGATTTITLNSGSNIYFKISNDLDREFTVTKFEIISSYNGTPTTRATSTDVSLLSDGTLTSGEEINLGYTLSSSQTANYWIGTYYLTDVATGESFTNSIKWEGVVW